MENTQTNESSSSGGLTPGQTGFLPSGDVVKNALRKFGAEDAQINTVLALLQWARGRRLQSIGQLGREVNIHAATLSKIFAGKYGAPLDNIAAKLDHFLRLQEERKNSFGSMPIVKTLRVVQDVSEFCELTRVSQTMSILWGPNQSGKSLTLEKIYAPSHNHGRTIYTSCLENGGATKLFLEDLLRACGITHRKSYGEMKRRVMKYFDPQTLLIVDEFHQTMIGRTLKMTTIEFIRSIHDKTGCGVVLCGTDVLPDMFEDAKFKKFLGQTANRGVLRRLIPATPYDEDVAALCNAYGFKADTVTVNKGEDNEHERLRIADKDAQKSVQQIASSNGIGKLCRYLQISRRRAAKRGEATSWDHFKITLATLDSWERGDRMRRTPATPTLNNGGE